MSEPVQIGVDLPECSDKPTKFLGTIINVLMHDEFADLDSNHIAWAFNCLATKYPINTETS